MALPEWPTEFAHPRYLPNTETWDRSYLELLDEGEAVQDERGEEGSDNDSGSDAGNVEETDEEGDERSEEGGENDCDSDAGNAEEDDEEEDEQHPVRRFMRYEPINGTASKPLRRDEEKVVSEFCELATREASERTEKSSSPYVAIADIRSNTGVEKNGEGTGVPRPWRGGLTVSQLKEELGITVSYRETFIPYLDTSS